LAAADELLGEEQYVKQAQACLRVLENESKKRQLDQLRAKMALAEREGRLEEALAWNAERERLRREMNGG
jgi:hypothetical protein